MTVSRTFVFAFAVVVYVIAAVPAQAQYRFDLKSAPPPSVLSPDPAQWWVGPQLGINVVSHVGDFVTKFCDCAFDNGSGVGVSAGLEFGHMLSANFGLAVKALYSDMSADYSYLIRREAQILSGEVVEVDFERKNVVKLGYFMINPVLQFYPFPELYAFMGPAVGVNTAGTQAYTLSIADDRYEFAIGDPVTRMIEEDSGEIPDVESLRVDFRVGLGVNIRLGRKFLIAPEVSYNMPLGNISSDDNWKAEAIHIIGVFKFEL